MPQTAPPLLSLRDISLAFGGHPLFQDLSLHIGPGDRLTLLGRNGAGKSSLMKVIAGITDGDSGERFLQPGTTVTYLEQEPSLGGYATLGAYIASAIDDASGAEDYRIAPTIDALQINADAPTDGASGGEARRAALARALVQNPDILLLDEPTNHLDIPTIEWLEGALSAMRCAMVLISHDRHFLGKLAKGCLWLERGQVIRFDGKFGDFPAWQERWLEAEATAQHKMDRLIKAEARWAVEGISARRKRNMGRVRRLADLRKDRAARIQPRGSVSMSVQTDSKGGKKVLDIQGLSKGYGDRTLFADLDFIIERGDRLAIIGPNGAGKSTLIGCLLGTTAADTGTAKLGTGLTPMIIDQKRSALEGDKTVAEILTGGSGDWVVSETGEKRHVSSVMKDFLFDPGVMNTPVSALSGGERNRLLLARGLMNPTNLMVLDEPTNDLDMDTLDLLVDLLGDYMGTLILVSHDRDFIDQVATTTLMLDGMGGAVFNAGGYRDIAAPGAGYLSSADKAKTQGSQSQGSAGQGGRPKSQIKKLSYKDQRELDSLPDQIKDLEVRISGYEAALAEGDFYSRDPDGFANMSAALTSAQEALETAEMRWLELLELEESLKS